MPDSSLDPPQEITEAEDVDQAGGRIGEGALSAECGRARAGGARRRSRSEDTVIWRPVFSCPGWRRSMSPEMMAHTLKERFIRLNSASQASRSSPSMSSSNNRARSIRPALHHRSHVVEPPDGERIFVGDETERRGACPFEPPREQHAETLMRETPLEGVADEIVPACRVEMSRPESPRDPERPRARLAGGANPRPGRAGAANPASRPRGAAPVRRDRSRAGICRLHRPAPWARSRARA